MTETEGFTGAFDAGFEDEEDEDDEGDEEDELDDEDDNVVETATRSSVTGTVAPDNALAAVFLALAAVIFSKTLWLLAAATALAPRVNPLGGILIGDFDSVNGMGQIGERSLGVSGVESRPEFESMLLTKLTSYLLNANTVKYGEELTIAVGGKMALGRSTLQK